jgi:adenylate cyclase class IV
MKTTSSFNRLASLVLIGAIIGITSCQDEEKRLTTQDAQDISEEAQVDTYYQELDDMGSAAISDDQVENGRTDGTITIQDDRFCGTVTIDYVQGSDVPQGVITVNFGTGCTDGKGNIRTGKVIFTYTGKRFQSGSKVITTVENYTINGIKLEGVRTSVNVTGSTEAAPKFNVKLENGKATFPDNAVATRNSDITWEWIKGQTRAADQLLIKANSSASGVTRGGRAYTMSVTEDLKYVRTCWIAVDGVKRYLLDGTKEVVIDYGVGNCGSVSVTVNGITRNLQVR